MILWVIIPIKSLPRTKSRLGDILSTQERTRLTQRLLHRTLWQVQALPDVDEIVLACQDATIMEIVTQYRCRQVLEPAGGGLNGALAKASAMAMAAGASHLLILPSDLPFMDRIELEKLVVEAKTAVSTPTLFLCGDQRQRGTNALLLPANVPFTFQYGPNSFVLHQKEAARRGLACHILRLPSIHFDLDTEEDYNSYTKNRLPHLNL